MIIRVLTLSHPLTIVAEPLTAVAFAPFGAVLANPAPDVHPQPNDAHTNPPLLPDFGAVSANQRTAIQYRKIAPPLRNLYAQFSPTAAAAVAAASSSSDKADKAERLLGGEPRTTIFVCGARQLAPDPENGTGDGASLLEVGLLERHPFTTQTFVPLGASASSTRYLVIVAPSLPPDDSGNERDSSLPTPPRSHKDGLPGPGMPDVQQLRAFVATGAQAVTYGAGTWHAPMAALGTPGSAIDFVVIQFANDVPIEDCQEVVLEGECVRTKVVPTPQG
ncbi:hypothetical protein GGS23DRAFT_577574 [Durotheca rogersii]|uniref:uncharacterized protein n=1 Tax=Durotheca rogersii TaxID=419775 RepID=UPI0022202F51|nr:uncharacterized protein GGS23DRAFT_577574 [Durotheca rogersii]KAI5861206.1 hypothetical protein GGS23DRAFT_577574 [Durotheca rogersii]